MGELGLRDGEGTAGGSGDGLAIALPLITQGRSAGGGDAEGDGVAGADKTMRWGTDDDAGGFDEGEAQAVAAADEDLLRGGIASDVVG
jgi:hypothetical protein